RRCDSHGLNIFSVHGIKFFIQEFVVENRIWKPRFHHCLDVLQSLALSSGMGLHKKIHPPIVLLVKDHRSSRFTQVLETEIFYNTDDHTFPTVVINASAIHRWFNINLSTGCLINHKAMLIGGITSQKPSPVDDF